MLSIKKGFIKINSHFPEKMWSDKYCPKETSEGEDYGFIKEYLVHILHKKRCVISIPNCV